jgi:hypothetical protein
MRVRHSLYGDVPAADFGPLALKVCREAMIGKGICRSTINGCVSRFRQVFRWAAENERGPGACIRRCARWPASSEVAPWPRSRVPGARPCRRNGRAARRPADRGDDPPQWLTGMRPQEVDPTRLAGTNCRSVLEAGV